MPITVNNTLLVAVSLNDNLIGAGENTEVNVPLAGNTLTSEQWILDFVQRADDQFVDQGHYNLIEGGIQEANNHVVFEGVQQNAQAVAGQGDQEDAGCGGVAGADGPAGGAGGAEIGLPPEDVIFVEEPDSDEEHD